MAWFGWGWSAGDGPQEHDVAPLGTLPQTALDVNLGSVMDVEPPAPGAGAGTSYAVGEVVDYFSASQGHWIPAKVLQANPTGTYMLDCKPDVPVEKIRPRRGGGSQRSAGAADELEFRAGDAVEYESASQHRWIPARVLGVTPRGNYDLDCKPDVPPSRVRRPGGGAGGAGEGGPPGTAFAVPWRSKAPPPQAELEEPVQLLRVHRSGAQWRYEVCREGLEALERYGSRRIAVASVCGLYRTGKSFLLNLLLERVQRGQALFKVGGSTRACTEGLWLYGHLGGSADDERAPLLAFLDCEGFGSTESDRQRDAQLMTLCALLSSVLVLNTRGALNEGLFNALALTCRFAEHIEERGHEASRPALLWVLRDFMLELQDADGRSLTPDEYLEQALQAAPTGSHDEDRARSAKEVRQSLLKFFSHRSCATLVQPASEEADLRDLETLPYSSLRSEFRSGVEALRARIVTACHANPKTVGGEPIGCRSFAALLRHLVEALNASRSLSVRGAWEAVQHGSCGQLADELRAQGTNVLRALAAGQRLEGGVTLPMADEALRLCFRQQRHALKEVWDERAVGDEAVRKEYWQELKESLAREEVLVRQQNARLADQRLQGALREWQAWLDDDSPPAGEGPGAGSAAVGERLAMNFGQLMDQLPAAPLSRTSRAALEAAMRRVVAARAAIAAAEEHYSEAKRKAEEFGAQATKQEGAARGELDAKTGALREAQDRLKRLEQDTEATQVELQGKAAELQDSKAQLEATLQDMEDARQREHELRAQHRITAEKEVALKSALQEARAIAARAEGDRMAGEGAARAAAEKLAAEQEGLAKELRLAKAESERLLDQLERERSHLQSKHDKHREEHARLVEDANRKVEVERSALLGDHERQVAEHERMVQEARGRLEEDRQRHSELLEGEQQRLLERERKAGLLEGQVDTLGSEAASLRERIAQLQDALRDAECKAGQRRAEGERLRSEIRRAHDDVEQARRDAEARARAREERDKENLRIAEEKKKGSKSFHFSAPFRSRRSKLPGSPNA